MDKNYAFWARHEGFDGPSLFAYETKESAESRRNDMIVTGKDGGYNVRVGPIFEIVCDVPEVIDHTLYLFFYRWKGSNNQDWYFAEDKEMIERKRQEMIQQIGESYAWVGTLHTITEVEK